MPAKRFSFGRVILAFVGLAVLVMGMSLSVSNAVFKNGALQTTGTVVDISWEGPAGTAQRPTIAYEDYQGRSHSVPLDVSSSDFSFAVGDEVEILYNFRTNNAVRLDTWGNGWQPGVLVALFGLFMLRLALRQRRAVVAGVPAKSGPWADSDPVSEEKAAVIAAIGQRHEKQVPKTAPSPVRPVVKAAPKPFVPTVRRMR